MFQNKKTIILAAFLAVACSDDATTTNPDPTFPGKITITGPSAPVNLGAVVAFEQEFDSNDADSATPNGFTFDLTDTGIIDDGFNDDNDDAFDGASEFNFITGDTFAAAPNFPARAVADATQAYLEDVDDDGTADQVVYVATSDAGLVVTRKIYTFPTYGCPTGTSACGLTRYLDCIENPTVGDITVTPELQSNEGSDGSGQFEGDALTTDSLASEFYFACNDNAGPDDPSFAYITGEAGATSAPVVDTVPGGGTICTTNDFIVNWGSQMISAGERSCLLHYVAIGNGLNDNDTASNPTSNMMEIARDVYDNSPRTGILPDEDKDIVNFKPGSFTYTVTGAAKSVPASKAVKVKNKTTAQTVTVTSAANGSFTGSIDCKVGEKIAITSTDFSKEVTCK